jgi:hypothetical protein
MTPTQYYVLTHNRDCARYYHDAITTAIHNGEEYRELAKKRDWHERNRDIAAQLLIFHGWYTVEEINCILTEEPTDED